MASFRSIIATGFLFLVLLALSKAAPAAMKHANHIAPVVNATAIFMTPAGECRPRDINIQQQEISGVGIPTWLVQIINECTDPLCKIGQVIVNCGAFHSSTFVNPRLFRRLDVKAGTCIVNDGNVIRNGDSITFQYHEIFKQPLTLNSARVTCSA